MFNKHSGIYRLFGIKLMYNIATHKINNNNTIIITLITNIYNCDNNNSNKTIQTQQIYEYNEYYVCTIIYIIIVHT